jgi:hypothetical protein
MKIIPETHQRGMLTIENWENLLMNVDLMNCDFGLQTHDDGRVWVCLNGIAFLRFKPTKEDK